LVTVDAAASVCTFVQAFGGRRGEQFVLTLPTPRAYHNVSRVPRANVARAGLEARNDAGSGIG